MIRSFLRRWLKPGHRYRMLDLCTASGDIPRVMVNWARRHRITLDIDAVDYQESTLEIARRWSTTYPEIRFHHGDAREAGGEGGSYDFRLLLARLAPLRRGRCGACAAALP